MFRHLWSIVPSQVVVAGSLRVWQPTSPDPHWIQTLLQCWNHTCDWQANLLQRHSERREHWLPCYKTDGFLLHVSRSSIIQPASSASDLCGIPCNQMKTFPSAVSAFLHFLGIHHSRPHKGTHALFHTGSASFHLLDGSPITYKWRNQNSWSKRHRSIMDNMSCSRKEGWPCSIYHCSGMWVLNHGGNYGVCVCVRAFVRVCVCLERTDVAGWTGRFCKRNSGRWEGILRLNCTWDEHNWKIHGDLWPCLDKREMISEQKFIYTQCVKRVASFVRQSSFKLHNSCKNGTRLQKVSLCIILHFWWNVTWVSTLDPWPALHVHLFPAALSSPCS